MVDIIFQSASAQASNTELENAYYNIYQESGELQDVMDHIDTYVEIRIIDNIPGGNGAFSIYDI